MIANTLGHITEDTKLPNGSMLLPVTASVFATIAQRTAKPMIMTLLAALNGKQTTLSPATIQAVKGEKSQKLTRTKRGGFLIGSGDIDF